MLTIVPADEATTRRCCEEAGREGNCLAMTENGEWKGYCLYTYDEQLLTIHTLETDEEILAEGLIRAAANIARNRMVFTLLCEDTRYPQLLTALGFLEQPEGLCVDVHVFFKPCCGGCHGGDVQ